MSFAFKPHEYFVSITEVEYNEQTQTFQMTIKYIGHDFEKALANAGSPELNLGTAKEDKSANNIIIDYINKTLEIKVNEKPINLELVGKEIGNDDFIYCYLESEKIRRLKNISMMNTMLFEVFEEQENITYFTINSKKHSFSFSKENRNQTLNLE